MPLNKRHGIEDFAKFRLYSKPIMPALCSKLAYYAGIMLDALACLLCLKLCRHNQRRPMYHCFYPGLFLSLSDIYECCQTKQTTSWELPYDLLVILAINLVTFYDMCSSKWSHLAVFMFSHKAPVTLWLPTALIGVLVIFTRLENKLSEILGNSASYPCNSWPASVPWIDTDK